MFGQLLNNEISKLKERGVKYRLEFNYYTLNDMLKKLDLERTIVIVKKIMFQGDFDISTWNANTTFLKVKSISENIDYSTLFEVSETNGLITVTSDFPSVHRTRLELLFDLSTFITNDATKIHHASVEYAVLNPLSNVKT